MVPPGIMEPTVKYHPRDVEALTKPGATRARTPAGGQFDWGGRLPNGNGGAPRFPQRGWPSRIECKGTRELDCKTDRSSRDESRT